jgi:hypothetical protein
MRRKFSSLLDLSAFRIRYSDFLRISRFGFRVWLRLRTLFNTDVGMVEA